MLWTNNVHPFVLPEEGPGVCFKRIVRRATLGHLLFATCDRISRFSVSNPFFCLERREITKKSKKTCGSLGLVAHDEQYAIQMWTKATSKAATVPLLREFHPIHPWRGFAMSASYFRHKCSSDGTFPSYASAASGNHFAVPTQMFSGRHWTGPSQSWSFLVDAAFRFASQSVADNELYAVPRFRSLPMLQSEPSFRS